MAITVDKLNTADTFFTITPSGADYLVEYDMQNRNINTIVLNIKWTKDTATQINILASYQDSDDSTTEYFVETKIDAAGNVLADDRLITADGSWRLIYNPVKSEEKILFTLTPDDLLGNDIILIAISENALGN